VLRVAADLAEPDAGLLRVGVVHVVKDGQGLLPGLTCRSQVSGCVLYVAKAPARPERPQAQSRYARS
jgi:hypothetical protein